MSKNSFRVSQKTQNVSIKDKLGNALYERIINYCEDKTKHISTVCLLIVKQDKDKVVPTHATKAYRWSRGIAPLILNLDNRPNR
jgi:hypothetical protein